MIFPIAILGKSLPVEHFGSYASLIPQKQGPESILKYAIAKMTLSLKDLHTFFYLFVN